MGRSSVRKNEYALLRRPGRGVRASLQPRGRFECAKVMGLSCPERRRLRRRRIRKESTLARVLAHCPASHQQYKANDPEGYNVLHHTPVLPAPPALKLALRVPQF